MIEHRHRLVGERTRSKNVLRALCRGYGLTCPKGLWSKMGLAWLRTIEWSNEMSSLQRDILVERVESLTAMIRRVEIVLKRRAEINIGVRLLMTIPGVGIRTAEAMVAYIDTADRFSCNKSVGGYLGLVPRQDASGRVNRLGHITKDGPGTVTQTPCGLKCGFQIVLDSSDSEYSHCYEAYILTPSRLSRNSKPYSSRFIFVSADPCLARRSSREWR